MSVLTENKGKEKYWLYVEGKSAFEINNGDFIGDIGDQILISVWSQTKTFFNCRQMEKYSN